MDSSVSGKDEIWFLRVCHHVPHELYLCAAMCDAVRFRSTLGNVPECRVGVLEIYREAYVIESANIMKSDSIKFLPLKRKHKARYLD